MTDAHGRRCNECGSRSAETIRARRSPFPGDGRPSQATICVACARRLAGTGTPAQGKGLTTGPGTKQWDLHALRLWLRAWEIEQRARKVCADLSGKSLV